MGRNDRGQLGNAQGLDQGLVGWYKFSGDVTDNSGNGNDGTVYGATLITDRFGQANEAYSFDGTDDWIDLNKIYLDSEFTNGLWFKSENNGAVIYGSYYLNAGYFMVIDGSMPLNIVSAILRVRVCSPVWNLFTIQLELFHSYS